jgi:hypothetical protein
MQEATLLVWREGIDSERIQNWIKRLEDLGVLETVRTNEFNSEETFPVLYLP